MKRRVKKAITNYPVVFLAVLLSVFSVFCAVKSGLTIVAAPVILLTVLLVWVKEEGGGKKMIEGRAAFGMELSEIREFSL